MAAGVPAAKLTMVGLVIVSHSARLAEGVVELAAQMAGTDVRLVAAGGTPSGTLGTSTETVRAAVEEADSGMGVCILGDIGSGILAAKAVLAELDGIDAALADAPLVEGAVSAAVAASAGVLLAAVVDAAEEARGARKL